jgi:hypothetical protein
MTPALKNVLLNAPFSPYRLQNNAAVYSLDGPASEASYLIDGSNRLYYVADRSGNSAVNGLVLPASTANYASFTALTAAGTGDFSVSAVVSTNAIGAGQAAIGSNDNGFALFINTSGKPQTALTSVANNTQSTATLVAFVKYTLAYVRSGTTGTYYVDGVAAGTTTDARNYTVGVRYVGRTDSAPNFPFNGIIYSARVYSTALSAAEIAADAAGTVPSNCTLNLDFTLQAKLAASPITAVTGQSVTINTSAIALPARIMGARDLYQGVQANQPIYLAYSGSKFGYLNGATGNYFSTPDAAATQITEDIDIRVHLAMDAWIPSAAQSIVSKWTDTGNQRGYLLKIQTQGKLQLFLSTNGSNFPDATSSVATGVTNFAAKWVRATWVKASGLTTFYTSDDGSTWTQLGTTLTLNANTATFNSTNGVEVGSDTAGSNRLAGKVFRAQVYNGIGGTLVADFNPALFTSGTTFTAATGEVWTRNAGAYIGNGGEAYFDGVNDYLKSAAFSLSQPESVYFTGSQVSWTSTDYVLDGGGTNGGAIVQTTSSPQLNLNAGSSVAGNTGLVLGIRGVLAALFNGASSSLGVNALADTTGNANTGSMNGFTLGARGAADANYGNITWSQTLVRANADDAGLMTRIRRYFMRTGGVS